MKAAKASKMKIIMGESKSKWRNQWRNHQRNNGGGNVIENGE
jgi:hypothetical protein